MIDLVAQYLLSPIAAVVGLLTVVVVFRRCRRTKTVLAIGIAEFLFLIVWSKQMLHSLGISVMTDNEYAIHYFLWEVLGVFASVVWLIFIKELVGGKYADRDSGSGDASGVAGDRLQPGSDPNPYAAPIEPT
ncbi:MAG TPA: hypothetical protein VEL07_06735 [Planctomycetota bacterium]|nr:hypothetical protein [Planctomycetota bacterium]